MDLSAKIVNEIEEKEREIAELRKILIEQYKNSVLSCKRCELSSKLREVIFVQTHWYERPYSCTSGDNWLEGEVNLLCPNCGCRHRLLSDKSKNKFLKFKRVHHLRIYEHRLDSYDNDRYHSKKRYTYYVEREHWYDRRDPITKYKGLELDLSGRDFVNI